MRISKRLSNKILKIVFDNNIFNKKKELPQLTVPFSSYYLSETYLVS